MHYIYYLYGIVFSFFYVEFIYLVVYKGIYKRYELDKYEGNGFVKYIDLWILCFISSLFTVIYNSNTNWKVVNFCKNLFDAPIIPYKYRGFGGIYTLLILVPWFYGLFIEDKNHKRRRIGRLMSILIFVVGFFLLVINT